jgi:hypothetical protein
VSSWHILFKLQGRVCCRAPSNCVFWVSGYGATNTNRTAYLHAGSVQYSFHCVSSRSYNIHSLSNMEGNRLRFCTATSTNGNNINTHQNKGNNNDGIIGPVSKEDPQTTMGMLDKATDTIKATPMLSSLSRMLYIGKWRR